ncbi:hypothetical protein SLA2020_412680 [Shorea laevis]
MAPTTSTLPYWPTSSCTRLEALVLELIDWEGPSWKVGLIREVFDRSTAELITQIPIGSINTNDRPTWWHNAHGEFSVKSAYHLQKQLIAASEGESSSSDHLRAHWRHLWKLRVPHAAKVFLWRACNNALPTKANLFRRKITRILSVLCAQLQQKQLATYCGVAQQLKPSGVRVVVRSKSEVLRMRIFFLSWLTFTGFWTKRIWRRWWWWLDPCGFDVMQWSMDARLPHQIR